MTLFIYLILQISTRLAHGTDIHGSQTMNPNDLSEPLTEITQRPVRRQRYSTAAVHAPDFYSMLWKMSHRQQKIVNMMPPFYGKCLNNCCIDLHDWVQILARFGMNSSKFCDPFTIHLVPSSEKKFNLSNADIPIRLSCTLVL